MKTLIMILLILVFFGCDPKDGEDGEDGTHPDEGTSALVEIENPMGFAEASNCLEWGDIVFTALDEDYKQLKSYNATTRNNKGFYKVEANVSGIKAKTSFRGWCSRETTEGHIWIALDVFSDLASTINVNIPGTIQGAVATYFQEDINHPGYENKEIALGYAELAVLDFFDLSGYEVDFSISSNLGDTTNDAVGTIISAVLDSRSPTGPEINDDMSKISRAIYKQDLSFKSDVIADRNSLKIKDIKNRLTAANGSCPPIWELNFVPEYYKDIFDNSHDVLESFNLGAGSPCNIDTPGFNSFAYPRIFTRIEEAVYYASELTGNISIWSVGTCNQGVDYPCPLTRLVSVEELNEILLEPALNYNGYLGTHGITNSTQIFIVQNFDTNQQPSHSCDGDMVPFGRNLAAVDNNWNAAIGWNNTTSWYRRGIKDFTTN
jgi:hypothetical protein